MILFIKFLTSYQAGLRSRSRSGRSGEFFGAEVGFFMLGARFVAIFSHIRITLILGSGYQFCLSTGFRDRILISKSSREISQFTKNISLSFYQFKGNSPALIKGAKTGHFALPSSRTSLQAPAALLRLLFKFRAPEYLHLDALLTPLRAWYLY